MQVEKENFEKEEWREILYSCDKNKKVCAESLQKHTKHPKDSNPKKRDCENYRSTINEIDLVSTVDSQGT